MASIPLPALQIRPAENPLDSYAKALSVKSQIQGQQSQQQEMQQRAALFPGQMQGQQEELTQQNIQTQLAQANLKDRQVGSNLLANPNTTQEMQKWEKDNGIDPSGATNGATGTGMQIHPYAQFAMSKGMSLPGALELSKNIYAGIEQAANVIKTQGEAAKARLDAHKDQIDNLIDDAAPILEKAKDDPTADLTTELGTFKNTVATNAGNYPPEFVKQLNSIQSPADLAKFTNIGGVQKRMIDDAQKQAASTKATQELPGGAQENPEQKFIRLQSQDKGTLGPEDQQWIAAYTKNKTMVPQFNFNLQGGAGGGLNQAALDQAAERYAQTGVLPAMGMGSAGAAARKAIMNRAGELHPAGSIAENTAAFAANEGSLKNLQKNFDQVTAFENTAGKNLDQFLSTAKNVVDSGSPWINQPLRAVSQGALGSADQAAFNAARQTALTEIAKVLNSSNANGVLSDSARGEVSSLIGKDATLKQIYSAANILKQDMTNRHQAYQEQIGDIQARIGKQPSANANNGDKADPLGIR